MNVALALGAGVGVFLIVAAGARSPLAVRLETDLRPRPPLPPRKTGVIPSKSKGGVLLGRLMAALAGLVTGLLLAQGDLFVAGPSRSTPALAGLGALSGALLYNMHLSTQRQRRVKRLKHELPVVAEAIAMHVMAGESVATAISRFVEAAAGVAAEELRFALEEAHRGSGMAEALDAAARSTVEPEASRLYLALGHAHVSGGRLGAALTDLAFDYRAALMRDIAIEGGRRSLTTYGPVLGLMVPVTLLFLLYPTIEGLRGLAP